MFEMIFWSYAISILAVWIILIYHERVRYGNITSKHVVLVTVCSLLPILNVVVAIQSAIIPLYRLRKAKQL